MDKNQQLSSLPDAPGIYLFYSKEKELIYVGKATSLRNRVRSYWATTPASPAVAGSATPPSKGGDRALSSPYEGEVSRPRRDGWVRPIESLLHEVTSLDWKVTDSALEAIILEANYIKKYLPKYNVIGKDDKSWNYITISKDEYPIVGTMREHDFETLKHRKHKNTENIKTIENYRYIFGPYPGLNAKATMKLLRKLFLISNCQTKKRIRKSGLPARQRPEPQALAGGSGYQDIKQRPCLYYEIGQCLGVCTGGISPKEYQAKAIRPLVTLLKGKKKALIKGLEVSMRKAAKAEDFEEAARLRNQIQSLQRIQDIALLNRSFFENEKLETRNLKLEEDQTQFPVSSFQFHPKRIEGYDISNLGPTGVVGSMVVFAHGQPEKSQYRKFKIRGFEGQSDVDALEEVIRRRLRHTEWPYPQLFLIDGGKPQVNRVKKIFAELKISIPIAGIAKGKERKRNDIVLDGLQTTDHRLRNEMIRWIYANTRLLIQVRDEAHRFAVSYQRKLRRIR